MYTLRLTNKCRMILFRALHFDDFLFFFYILCKQNDIKSHIFLIYNVSEMDHAQHTFCHCDMDSDAALVHSWKHASFSDSVHGKNLDGTIGLFNNISIVYYDIHCLRLLYRKSICLGDDAAEILYRISCLVYLWYSRFVSQHHKGTKRFLDEIV